MLGWGSWTLFSSKTTSPGSAGLQHREIGVLVSLLQTAGTYKVLLSFRRGLALTACALCPFFARKLERFYLTHESLSPSGENVDDERASLIIHSHLPSPLLSLKAEPEQQRNTKIMVWGCQHLTVCPSVPISSCCCVLILLFSMGLSLLLPGLPRPGFLQSPLVVWLVML